MDDFAQTRPPDDLFSDDIAPPPPQQVQQEDHHHHQQEQQQERKFGPQGSKWENAPDVPTGPRESFRGGRGPRQPRGEGRGRGRRSGRGRGNRGRGNHDDYNRNIPHTVPTDPTDPAAPDVSTAPPTDTLDPTDSTPSVPDGTPTGPRPKPGDEVKLDRSLSRPIDRTLTGGPPPPRLTPEELEAKMAKAKLHNQKLIERRLAAEEDERRFREEEEERAKLDAVEKEKARVARIQQERAQKELNAEREKNRQRKMKAATGRDWDAEKREEDFKEEKRGRFGRGAHGSFVTEHLGDAPPPRGFDSRRVDYGDRAPRGPRGDGGFEERGRGRGRGRRGGRGRGDYEQHVEGGHYQQRQERQQVPPKPEEFPALPGSDAPKPAAPAKVTPAAIVTEKPKGTTPPALSPIKGSWADEAEDALGGGKMLSEVVKGVEKLEKKEEVESPKVEKPSGGKMNWADEVDDAT